MLAVFSCANCTTTKESYTYEEYREANNALLKQMKDQEQLIQNQHKTINDLVSGASEREKQCSNLMMNALVSLKALQQELFEAKQRIENMTKLTEPALVFYCRYKIAPDKEGHKFLDIKERADDARCHHILGIDL